MPSGRLSGIREYETSHTHSPIFFLPSFLSLPHTHRGDWSTAGRYPKNSIWRKEKLSLEREDQGEGKGDMRERKRRVGGVSFYTPVIKTENPSQKKDTD